METEIKKMVEESLLSARDVQETGRITKLRTLNIVRNPKAVAFAKALVRLIKTKSSLKKGDVEQEDKSHIEIEKMIEEPLLNVHNVEEARRIMKLNLRILDTVHNPKAAVLTTKTLVALIKARDALKKGGADGLVGALEELIKLLRETGFELDVGDMRGVYKLDKSELNKMTMELEKEINDVFTVMDLIEDIEDDDDSVFITKIALLSIALGYFKIIDGVGNIICKVNGCQRYTLKLVCK